MNQYNGYRQLKSNKNSKVLVLITSHGGENFIKVRNSLVVLSDELNRTLNEMYIKGMYKELLFIVDTCEGFSLYKNVNVPDIYFISSSALGQKASSYSYDEYLMGPTVDKFHFLLYNSLKDIHANHKYNITVEKLFADIKAKKEFLGTDVCSDNKIDRVLYVNEYFGNNELKNEKMINVSDKIDMDAVNGRFSKEDIDIVDSFIKNNKGLEKKRKELDKEIMKMRNYHEEQYTQ